MSRTTINELEEALKRINRRTDLTLEMDIISGKVRICTNDGGRYLSPRMKRSEAIEWLDTFLVGWDENNQFRKEND